MEYRDAKDLKVREGSFRSGGRWKGRLKGEKSGRLFWMKRSFKHKRTWAYDPNRLTGLELQVDKALHPDEYRVQGMDEPAYNDLEPTVSHFTLVEEACRQYGTGPDDYWALPYDTTIGDEGKRREDY